MFGRFLILFSVLTMSSFAQDWKQSMEETKVTFKIKNFGVNVDGSFVNIDIETNFDSKKLENSYINGKVAVKSVETGIEGRDKHLLKEDYFHENKHSFILLKSTKIKKKSDNDFVLLADLTMKGITKKVELSLQVVETQKTIQIFSDFTLNRKDFDIGGGSFIMSKKVKIKVEYFGTKDE